MIPYATWNPLSAEERTKLLNDRIGDKPRDVACHALCCTDRAELARFVEGITNIISIREGNAAGKDADGNDIPARGQPGTFYTRYREGEEIEIGGTIQTPPPKDAFDVCGDWAGGTPPGVKSTTGRRRLAINTAEM